jgi:hypothetical protein
MQGGARPGDLAHDGAVSRAQQAHDVFAPPARHPVTERCRAQLDWVRAPGWVPCFEESPGQPTVGLRQPGRLALLLQHVQPSIAHRAMLIRTRLLDRLVMRWLAPVTVVTAPAGYGKTTLVAQAVAANQAAPMGIDCWVTCRPDSAVASALAQRICRAVGASDISVDIPSFFGAAHATGVAEITTAVVEAMRAISATGRPHHRRRSRDSTELRGGGTAQLDRGVAAPQRTRRPGRPGKASAVAGPSRRRRPRRPDRASRADVHRGRDGRLRPATRGVCRPAVQNGRLACDG